ncbi:hypothetical protein [Pseudonocardia abyssalis]|uniref:TfoX N-terminal domain-containing protein n=1 Tax=Pseudonocardia abyssalis TaxID=2792008 RepID=A0ABS6V0Y8_9PSEU|nr:hypothetical protein [Pseudonocardia abyssalis]MBW0116468.1 hypothetical protein [Pseudonocardia abyssalis]MBW0138150.1 hypothetical protein [Pseudonocardia abyssalis]
MGTDAAARYAAVVEAFDGDPHVEPPRPGARGFGSNALRTGGSIFAMLDVYGRFVVKLDAARVAELIDDGVGAPFDNGHGRSLRAWLVLGPEQDWLAYAREARSFGGGDATP